MLVGRALLQCRQTPICSISGRVLRVGSVRSRYVFWWHLVVLEIEKTAGMVEINRNHYPLALDSPVIPVGGVGISACGEIQGCGDCKPGLPSGDDTLRSTRPHLFREGADPVSPTGSASQAAGWRGHTEGAVVSCRGGGWWPPGSRWGSGP